MGNKGLYSNWLKQFTLVVFNQTFHAFLLYFILRMLAAILHVTNGGTVDPSTYVQMQGLAALFSVVGMMGLIKFEKTIKKLFGIEDSLAGDAKTSGAKLVAGFKGAQSLINTGSSGFKGHKEAKGKLSDNAKKIQKVKDRITQSGGTVGGIGGSGGIVTSSEGAPKVDTSGGESSDGSTPSVGGTGTAPAAQPSSRMYKLQDQLEDLEAERVELEEESRKQARDKYYNLAGSIATASIGMGMFDETSEGIAAGAVMNAGVSRITTKIAKNRAKADINADFKKAIKSAEADIKPNFAKAMSKASTSDERKEIKKEMDAAINQRKADINKLYKSYSGKDFEMNPKGPDIKATLKKAVEVTVKPTMFVKGEKFDSMRNGSGPVVSTIYENRRRKKRRNNVVDDVGNI